MRTLVIVVAVIIGMFASAGPIPVRAQGYTPPALTPVAGPNCPSIPIAGGTLQTAPWPYTYSVCTYPRLGSSDGRANVTVPGGIALRWRYYIDVQTWWWPFTTYKQEVTAFAYSGQTVLTDWFEVYYSPYLTYAPGVPIYQPPGQWPPPSQPPTQPSLPPLPAPGTPPPPRTPTGVGNFTLSFGQGWSVAGWEIRYQSNPWQVAANNCHIRWTREPGWVTDGVITPNDGDIARAPTPCP